MSDLGSVKTKIRDNEKTYGNVQFVVQEKTLLRGLVIVDVKYKNDQYKNDHILSLYITESLESNGIQKQVKAMIKFKRDDKNPSYKYNLYDLKEKNEIDNEIIKYLNDIGVKYIDLQKNVRFMGYYNPTESILEKVPEPQSETKKRKIQNNFSNSQQATSQDLEEVIKAFEGNFNNFPELNNNELRKLEENNRQVNGLLNNQEAVFNPLLTNEETNFGFTHLEEDHGNSEKKTNPKRRKSVKTKPKKSGGKRKTRKTKKTKW